MQDEESIKEFEDILLPHQIERLSELHFRCLVRSHGLRRLLGNDQVRQFLKISEADVQQIAKASRKMRSVAAKSAKKAYVDSLEMFFSSFRTSDLEIVLQSWGSLEKSPNASLEHLIVLFDFSVASWVLEGKEGKKFLDRPEFSSGAAGDLQVEPKRKIPQSELNLFRDLWVHEEFKESLQLSEEKHLLVVDLVNKSFESSQIMLNVNLEKSAEPFKARNERAKEKADKIDEKSIRDIKQAIGSDRWERIGNFTDAMAWRCSGPVMDALYGPLSKKLKLSEKEEKVILKKAEEAATFLKDESRKIEEQIIEGLLQDLSEAGRRNILKRLGRPVKDVPANIQLMLMFL